MQSVNILYNMDWYLTQSSSPLAWIFSQLGEIMTHLILCSFMCLVTSLRPMTRRRLDLALVGSFWYTRSWKRTSSCNSIVTLSSISLLNTWLQYLQRKIRKGYRCPEYIGSSFGCYLGTIIITINVWPSSNSADSLNFQFILKLCWDLVQTVLKQTKYTRVSL